MSESAIISTVFVKIFHFLEDSRLIIGFAGILLFLALLFVYAALRLIKNRKNKLFNKDSNVLKREKLTEDAMVESSIFLNKIKTNLSSMAEKRADSYYISFTEPLCKITGSLFKTAKAAANLEKENIAEILRLCNHRVFVLTLKKSIHSLAENILVDFGRVVTTLELNIKMPDKNSSLKYVINYFLPILSHYQPILIQMPEFEKKLMSTSTEYYSLAKPGFFLKTAYFFSNEKEKTDTAKLGDICNAWDTYLDLWHQLNAINEIALEHLKALIFDYNMKIFVFTPCEHLLKHVIKTKTTLDQMYLEKALDLLNHEFTLHPASTC